MINRRTITALTATGVIALGTAGAAQARHGADDPAPHHHAHGKHHRHGADDRGARQGRGTDDGPNHT